MGGGKLRFRRMLCHKARFDFVTEGMDLLIRCQGASLLLVTCDFAIIIIMFFVKRRFVVSVDINDY